MFAVCECDGLCVPNYIVIAFFTAVIGYAGTMIWFLVCASRTERIIRDRKQVHYLVRDSRQRGNHGRSTDPASHGDCACNSSGSQST